MNRRILFLSLALLLHASVLPASPPGTYLLQQKYTPGTYYRVTNIDSHQKIDSPNRTDAGLATPELNDQQILVEKIVISDPDEKGNKTITITFERIQRTVNINDDIKEEYDSKAEKSNVLMAKSFAPLLKARAITVLDKEDKIISVKGLEGIWKDTQETNPETKSLLKLMKDRYNNESIKKEILFNEDYLPDQPVVVGESWTKKVKDGSMKMTLVSVEKKQGRRLALIVFSGNIRRKFRDNKSNKTASSDPKVMMDIQRKGMLRFDLAAGRIPEANWLESVLTKITIRKREKQNKPMSNEVTMRTAVAMKEYSNEVPPELTEPPVSIPASAPAGAK